MPPPAGRMARSAAVRAISKVPDTLSAITACQPLPAIASAGTKYWPPALLTNVSSRPWRSSAVSITLAASLGSRTSPVAHEQGAPISPAARSNGSWRRPVIRTLAPHAASSRAVASPSPVPPPVTSATCPSSSPGTKVAERVSACTRLQHLADEALPHAIGLAQHPHLLPGRLGKPAKDFADEALPHAPGLAQHPDLLVQWVPVTRLEDLTYIARPHLARLVKHPALFVIGHPARGRARHRGGSQEDRTSEQIRHCGGSLGTQAQRRGKAAGARRLRRRRLACGP